MVEFIAGFGVSGFDVDKCVRELREVASRVPAVIPAGETAESVCAKKAAEDLTETERQIVAMARETSDPKLMLKLLPMGSKIRKKVLMIKKVTGTLTVGEKEEVAKIEEEEPPPIYTEDDDVLPPPPPPPKKGFEFPSWLPWVGGAIMTYKLIKLLTRGK